MQRAAGSFPGPLSVSQQSLGRGCRLTACATQTLPASKRTDKLPAISFSPYIFSVTLIEAYDLYDL